MYFSLSVGINNQNIDQQWIKIQNDFMLRLNNIIHGKSKDCVCQILLT